MAKPRKTLGGTDWPVCEALMRQIETQSTVTLSRWAVDHAAREYLPLCGEAPALKAAVEGCRKHLIGQLSLKELKPLLRKPLPPPGIPKALWSRRQPGQLPQPVL